MSIAKMTLIGLMKYYESNYHGYGEDLFDLLNLPEGIDKNTVINNILMKGGEFEVLYPNADYTRAFIGVWGQKWYRTFDKWVAALAIQYEPLYNFDRYEEYEDNGTLSNTKTGTLNNGTTISETVNNTGTQTSALQYNSDTTDIKSGKDTTTRTDNLSESTSTSTSGTTTKDETKTSRTNGTVTQSVDTLNNQTQTETNTNNSATTTRTTSAFNSNDPVFDNSDILTGGNTRTIAYSGSTPDNQTTTTSVSYGAANGDTEDIDSTDTVSESVTGSKSNTGTETNEITYDSDVTRQNRGIDTTTRTDNLIQTTSNTISGTGSTSDTSNGTTRNVHTGHLYGNIGVTTTQQMLESELNIAMWNLYDHIADIFIDEFCIKVY